MKPKSIDEEKLLKKEGIFGKITQYTLFLTVILVIFGQLRIVNHDIRVLYSLGMIVGSAVGKYGSYTEHHLTRYEVDKNRLWQRNLSYTLLWIFGSIGLIL